jgi:hypothetical protein
MAYGSAAANFRLDAQGSVVPLTPDADTAQVLSLRQEDA